MHACVSFRRRVGRFGIVASILLLLLQITNAGGVVSAAPSLAIASDYEFYQQDNFAFWDGTGKSVYVTGAMNWFSGGGLLGYAKVYKGVIAKQSYVILNRQGCLWVKISFTTVEGTVSWPPSGSANTVSDGYYRYCGEYGTYIYLDGITHASRTLLSATLCIGYSFYNTYEIRRYQSCDKMWN